MIREADRERVRQLLIETLPALCKSGLGNVQEVGVDALIGITLNKSDVILVNIKETLVSDDELGGSNDESDSGADGNVVRMSEADLMKKRRRKRKRPKKDTIDPTEAGMAGGDMSFDDGLAGQAVDDSDCSDDGQTRRKIKKEATDPIFSPTPSEKIAGIHGSQTDQWCPNDDITPAYSSSGQKTILCAGYKMRMVRVRADGCITFRCSYPNCACRIHTNRDVTRIIKFGHGHNHVKKLAGRGRPSTRGDGRGRGGGVANRRQLITVDVLPDDEQAAEAESTYVQVVQMAQEDEIYDEDDGDDGGDDGDDGDDGGDDGDDDPGEAPEHVVTGELPS